MIIGLASPIPDLASLPGPSRPGHPVPGGGGGPGKEAKSGIGEAKPIII